LTNTKEISKKIQEHILGFFDDYKDMMSELKNYQKIHGKGFGKILCEDGKLLMYNTEIDEFFQDLLKQTPEQQKKYSTDDSFNLYANLIQREATHIVSEDNRCYIKPESIKAGTPPVKDSIPQELKQLSEVIEYGKSQIVKNNELGSIHIDKGHIGKNGYGLLHIIENRTKEGRPTEETTAILHLVTRSSEEGNISRKITDKNDPSKIQRIELEKNGIVALVSCHRFNNEEKWLLTGFDDRNKKEEATEAIQTVIAQYGRSPEFSYFRKQVGAVVSSLSKISPELAEKSSKKIEQAKKAGFVQGVCECVSIVDDNKLGKKLLSEMKVSKEMARQYADPKTYESLEKTVFAPKPVQEQKHGRKR